MKTCSRTTVSKSGKKINKVAWFVKISQDPEAEEFWSFYFSPTINLTSIKWKNKTQTLTRRIIYGKTMNSKLNLHCSFPLLARNLHYFLLSFCLLLSFWHWITVMIIINKVTTLWKKKKKHVLEITHLVFMGTSYDVKEKVYVALVDNSESLE